MRTMMMRFLMGAMLLPLMLSACKKQETAGSGTTPMQPRQTNERERLEQSFEASKKVTALKVNGEIIAEFFVLREMNTIGPRYLKPGQARTPELDARIRRDALDIVIFQALAVQEARKRGMQVKPEVMDAEIARLKEHKGPGRSFQDYLTSNGLTEEEFRRALEQEYLFEQIAAREIDAKVTVTEAAVKERYAREKTGLQDASHRQMTFDEAKGLLEQRLREEAGEKRMREWEAELRRNARIEIMEQKQNKG